MLKKLIKEIFKQKGICLLFFIGILDQFLMVSIPYFGKIFIEFIEKGTINNEFYFYLIGAIIIGFLGIIMGSLSNYLKKGIITHFEISKNIYYFKKFFGLDFEYRNQEGTGKTITKINRGIDAQVSLFGTIIEAILILGIRFSIILVVIFTVYKSIIFAVFLVAFILFFFSKYIGNKLKKLTEEEQEISEVIGRQTNKMIMESNLIKVLNREDFELGKLGKIFEKLPFLRQKIVFNNNITYDVMHAFFQLLEFLSYLIIGILVIKSQMTIGELFLIVSYIWWLWRPVSIVIKNASEYRSQISKYEALEKFINQENKIQDGEESFQIKSGEIEFKNISFGYNENNSILKDFSIKFEGGKKTALVGHSGSGKSTLIKLILRNYLVNNGKILVDGQDLNDFKISSFYENIGYLSQEPAVFDGTIRENLEYGIINVENEYFHSENSNNVVNEYFHSDFKKQQWNENIRSLQKSQEDILRESLKKVNLYDLIKNSKDGLETEIGEKGLKLSGGEKQRLAIARIFLRNPKILILDEPTSALDSISEHKITNIINEVMKDRTVIVIAHRLQTVLGADKIVVLEKGEIIETGTHDELILQKGTYSKLVDLQKGVINE